MADAESRLLAVSPIDGRYEDAVSDLQPILSEFGLIHRRVAVEVGWLATLGSGVLPDVEPLGQVAQDHLLSVAEGFTVRDAASIKAIERATNHDVKAVELWLRDVLRRDNSFRDYLELIHFGATSEDINNLAYGMQVRDTRDTVLQPRLTDIRAAIETKAAAYATIPMLSRTHGQAATPTTLGKEMRVFSERLGAHQQRLGAVAVNGKFNGATGNYNAMTFAYPEVNWPAVSRRFVESLGITFNATTTQIEPHDWVANVASETALGNTILTDLARDMWTYISLGYFDQVAMAGETGSSTMPHKVNPIDFENAEANFGIASALLDHLARKLPISRLQRDLSDSSAQRSLGEAFGHTVIAHRALSKGLGKVHANPENIARDLDNEYSVLTEAVQTVMRRHGVQGAYEQIKAVSRGRSLSRESYLELVESIGVPEEAKRRLRELTPSTYIGRATEIAEQTVTY